MLKSKTTFNTVKKRKAFALLMSLFLMGFLVVLVLTLSSIVQLQLRSSRQNVLDQRAKNAARFAALQALGEVQKALGPDQRITANASILDTELNDVFDDLENDTSYSFWSYDPLFNRDDVNQIDGISNPHWLGVWDSTPGYHPMPRLAEDDRTFTSERFIAYATTFLVSGNHSIKREDVLPDDTLLAYDPTDELADNYINMLRKNSITDENGVYDSDTMRVRVPLVTMPMTDDMATRSFLETRIGWWVSDESQKASLNVLASEDEFEIMNDDNNKVTQLQSLPYKNGIQSLIVPESSITLFDIDLDQEEDRNYLRALTDLTQIDLFQNEAHTNSAAKFLYNSITLDTRGLFVNVRNGGLKKDLTVGLLSLNPSALDSDPQYFDRPMGVEGYDAYLTNPSKGNGSYYYNIFSSNSVYTNKKGHMFGPQAVENIDLTYVGLSYNKNKAATDDVSNVHEDPGGPLWDSLREYYNNRVDVNGYDINTNNSSGYANKVKTKTDVTTGLSPVLLHYQLFLMPTLANYGGTKYGVRIYFIPIVVLWNPYDIEIAAGSTYAFSHGNAEPALLGDFRVAVGIKNGDVFECIRDRRTENMPRPTPNSDGDTGSPTYANSTSGPSQQSSIDTSKMNFYRAVSFSDERLGNISVRSSGLDDGTTKVETGKKNTEEYPINKSYFGYGSWNYEDTQSLVAGVEDDAMFPTGNSNVSNNDITTAGLIRIYNKGEHSGNTMTLKQVEVKVPDYYVLSPDSFFYRKLYLNNLFYSLNWTGQRYLYDKGGINTTTEATAQSKIYSAATTSVFRFLVRNEEPLEAGAARIFSLKESIPYHFNFDGSRGYAGDFALAEENGWYLTEGVETDSIGGFFVDVMHPERTHLASVENTYAGTSRNPAYNASNWRNIELDPLTVCAYDGMELGVLFDTSENLSYSDDSGTASTVSVYDICIDIDKWNIKPKNNSYGRRVFVVPYYMEAESAYNPNPWTGSTSTLPDGSDGLNLSRISYGSGGGGDFLIHNDLLMWNYADDNGAIDLYYDADDVYDDTETAAEGDDYEGQTSSSTAGYNFQTLKRYTLFRPSTNAPVATQSFPDPLRITQDWCAGGTTAWRGYFQISDGMSAFYGNSYGTTSTGSDATDSTNRENPAFEEQGIFVNSNNTSGKYGYGLNVNYTSNASSSSFLTMTGVRDKVRGMNKPIYNTKGTTIFEGYYKNLMTNINSLISAGGGGAGYTDFDEFLSDMGIADEYSNRSWIWEDTYFLLRNPRRVSHPRWPTNGITSSNTGDQYKLWRDNLPKAVQVKNAKQIVTADSSDGLPIEAFDNDSNSISIFEGLSAYRPVSKELANSYSDDEIPFQYPFRFPWLTQSNATGKMFGDGKRGNAGAVRDLNYGTDSSRGGSRYHSAGAIANNFQFMAFQPYGEEGTEGNFNLGDWFCYLTEKYSNDKASDGETYTQVQIGPDPMSDDTYRYTLRRYLRDYEIVTSPVDLATADLAFGAELNRTLGYGTGTADIYYPNNLMGSSFAHMRIAPERPYDYNWLDGHTDASSSIALSGNGIRAESEIARVSYDMVWMMNEIFWDEYFFSTIPYRTSEQNTIDDYYSYLIPKNPRIEYINKNKDKIYTRVDDDMVSLDNTIEDTDDLDYDFDSNSIRFWLRGAFNVNSTNVDAWKMVLATSFGNDIYALDGTSTTNDDKAPFPRNGMPYTAEEFDKDGVRGNEQLAMQGYRALDRTELEELALSMVENIKDRGPFFSLADFVNRAVELRSGEMRRMGTSNGYDAYDFSNDFWDDPENDYDQIMTNLDEVADKSSFFLRQDHMQKGVIQAAIDLTSINQAFFDEEYLIDYDDEDAALNSKYTKIAENNEWHFSYLTYGTAYNYTADTTQTFFSKFGNPRNVWENYRAILGSSMAGAPTYLTQSDILKQIGSFITVRGDTFKIRAYGEVRNPMSEEIESKAWCEMLVQRYPEYMDATENSPLDVNNREKELGYQGGRTEYDSLLLELETSQLNKHLGRRFKIVSFRWLSEREI